MDDQEVKYIQSNHNLGFMKDYINSFTVAKSYFFLNAMNLQASSIKCLGTPAFWAIDLA